MSGAPGAGKSTLARTIQSKYPKDEFFILSTDDYWGPEYDFEISKLRGAHIWNQKRCKDYCELGRNVIIDNTNTTFKEVENYLDIAKEFGYWVSVVRPTTDWAVNAEACYNKNVHGVPYETVLRMVKRLDWDLEKKVLEYMINE